MTTFSARLLRLLLRTYPREFRERFGADLEADFEQLLHTRGRAAAWRFALSDLRRAIPMTHTDDQRARQRRYTVTLGGESHMGTLTFDLRHSLRALMKSPVFTIVTDGLRGRPETSVRIPRRPNETDRGSGRT